MTVMYFAAGFNKSVQIRQMPYIISNRSFDIMSYALNLIHILHMMRRCKNLEWSILSKIEN